MADSPFQKGDLVHYNSVLVVSRKRGLFRLRCPFTIVDLREEHPELLQVEYVQFKPNLPYFKTKRGLIPCFYCAIIN